jgi:hypothetical protein
MISGSGGQTSGRDARRSDQIQRADRRAAASVSRARMLAVAGVLVTFAIGAAVAMASRTKKKAATPFVACIEINPGGPGTAPSSCVPPSAGATSNRSPGRPRGAGVRLVERAPSAPRDPPAHGVPKDPRA